MDVIEAIRSRKSIRGYKPDPVPRSVIQEIIDAAVWAPSAMNSQPWEFTVVTGDGLDKIRQANVEKLKSGANMGAEHISGGWPKESIYRDRQVDLAKQLFSLMNIQREDKDKRTEWLMRGFRFFDAPVGIIISVDKVLSQDGPLLDIGAVMQNICLAAVKFGLGTCIEDQGIMYPDTLREYACIPESRRIIIAIALGYPDPEFPANNVETRRFGCDQNTTWIGFE